MSSSSLPSPSRIFTSVKSLAALKSNRSVMRSGRLRYKTCSITNLLGVDEEIDVEQGNRPHHDTSRRLKGEQSIVLVLVNVMDMDPMQRTSAFPMTESRSG